MKRLICNSYLYGEPEGFFTREDEIEFIEEPLMEKFPEINGCRAYIDITPNNKQLLSVDISTDEFEITAEVIIDMRRITKPADLGKYLPAIVEQYKTELTE